MIQKITAPWIVAGPRANGRDYGVLARSPEVPLRDGQIEHIVTTNHHMIDWTGRFPLLHFFMPIRGETGHWFLGTCRGLPPVAGNAVAITGGIVLTREQLEAIGWRADRLVDARFDPEPVFAHWHVPERRRTRVDPITFEIEVAHAVVGAFDKLAPIINVLPRPMVVFDGAADSSPEGVRHAVAQIGNVLAAAPFERAEELAWATSPVFNPLAPSLAMATGAAEGRHIEVHVLADKLELRGIDAVEWQTERDWCDVLIAAQASPELDRDVAAMLDDHRRHPAIADRLAACLTYIREQQTANPEAFDYWYVRLLIDLCALVKEDLRGHFHQAAERLPGPASASVRPLLEGGAQSRARRAGYGPAAMAKLATPADEPLGLGGLLTDDEAALVAITEAGVAASEAGCDVLLAWAIRKGVDDPVFASLMRAAGARPAQQAPSARQAEWMVEFIPQAIVNKRLGAEQRLGIQAACQNMLDRIGASHLQHDEFPKKCQAARLRAGVLLESGRPDPLAIRDFVFAFIRKYETALR